MEDFLRDTENALVRAYEPSAQRLSKSENAEYPYRVLFVRLATTTSKLLGPIMKCA